MRQERGFAVVAGEIGQLANDSAQAAEAIRQVSASVIEAVNALSDTAGRNDPVLPIRRR